MKKSFLFFLFGVFSTFTVLAQQTIVKGSVKDAVTDEPIPDVTVTIEESNLTTKTDAFGQFTFKQNLPLGEQILKIEKVDYTTKRYPIVVNEGKTLDIQDMTLSYNASYKKDLYIISISDDQLNS